MTKLMLVILKIMKDMERWAKIQNRQKDCVRSPSPVLRGGPDDDRKQSKSADAGFAVFERKVRRNAHPAKIYLSLFPSHLRNCVPTEIRE